MAFPKPGRRVVFRHVMIAGMRYGLLLLCLTAPAAETSSAASNRHSSELAPLYGTVKVVWDSPGQNLRIDQGPDSYYIETHSGHVEIDFHMNGLAGRRKGQSWASGTVTFNYRQGYTRDYYHMGRRISSEETIFQGAGTAAPLGTGGVNDSSCHARLVEASTRTVELMCIAEKLHVKGRAANVPMEFDMSFGTPSNKNEVVLVAPAIDVGNGAVRAHDTWKIDTRGSFEQVDPILTSGIQDFSVIKPEFDGGFGVNGPWIGHFSVQWDISSGITMHVKEVNFLQDHKVVRDKSGSFEVVTDPVWKSTNSSDKNGEVAYTRDKKIKVSAKFEISPSLSVPISDVTVEAEIPGLGKVQAKGQTLSGNSYDFPATESDNKLPNTTKFYNPLTLNWKFAIGGSSNYSDAGSSRNKVYVTLKDPRTFADVGEGIPVTLLNLAIRNDGATDDSTAIQKTWQNFSGPANVKTWDGRSMYYYKAGVGFDRCALTYHALIQTSPESGQCGSFAQLLMGVLAVNGVLANWVTISTADGSKMIVKNWQFTSTSYPVATEYKWKLETNPGDYMVPTLPLDQYGDLKNVGGLAGQNSPRPSEKIFDLHFIVKADGRYYDPSYGVTYSGEGGFETSALEGYAVNRFGDLPRIDSTGRPYSVLRVRKVGGSSNITFTVGQTN